jgi:hypothetical protein
MKNVLRSVPLVLFLVLSPLAHTVSAQQLNDTTKADKVRAEVARRISSKKERVTVKLQNGNEVKGNLAHAGDDAFTITVPKPANKHRWPTAKWQKLTVEG